MKLVKAIIREERLPFVKKALEAREIFGMTISQVLGRGEQRGIHLQYRKGILNIDLLPKVSIEIVVKNEMEDLVVTEIMHSARTGKPGDGKIFILPVSQAHRIRTGEVEA